MNLPPSRIREHVREWTEPARDDRETLQTLGAAGRPRIIAFHAQQAVEKLLKGLLVSYGVDPEETHVLRDLVAQVHRLDRTLVERLGRVDDLTRYAVTTRYPSRAGRASRPLDSAHVTADVAMAVAACEALDAAIDARLQVLESQSR